MQQVLERQEAYRWLDSAPVTIAAKDHRPPYGSDGDYFSKPNMDDIFETVYEIMREAAPDKYPELFNVGSYVSFKRQKKLRHFTGGNGVDYLVAVFCGAAACFMGSF